MHFNKLELSKSKILCRPWESSFSGEAETIAIAENYMFCYFANYLYRFN